MLESAFSGLLGLGWIVLAGVERDGWGSRGARLGKDELESGPPSARRRGWLLFSVLCSIVIWGSALTSPSLAGQQSETSDTAAASTPMTPPGYTGPPIPVLPEVVTRSESGVTIRAVGVDEPPRIDGSLDETVYVEIRPISGFTQIEPRNGAPASQQTEIWLLFDNAHVYVSARLWESELDRMVADEMRHDAGATLAHNELFTVTIDTFYDRRNGYFFYINPLGGRGEGQVSNESQYNGDWNGIWESTTGRFEGGWTVEMAIPFKSLRYQPDEMQVWGFQVQRINRWKNEINFLAPSDPARGNAGFMLASLFATAVGVEVPPPAMNLDVKPYIVSDLTTDRAASPPLSNAADADLGLDVKYGVTESLVADFTYNTDFAQVEAANSRSTSPGSACSFPKSESSFSRIKGRSRSGEPAPAPLAGAAIRRSCSTAGGSG